MTAALANAIGPDATYAAFLANGSFKIQRCICGEHLFFPRMACTHCGSFELSWVDASGGATLYSFTVVARKPSLGGDYNVALVDLDEGPRLMSRIAQVPLDRLSIGMRLRARIAGPATLPFVEFVEELPS